VWFRSDDGSSLLVEDGETVTISASGKELQAVILRPLTTTATLVACGILTTSPARLSDAAAFESLDTVEGYVDVKRPGPDGRIGGYTQSFLRRILTVLNPEVPIPKSVSLPQGSDTERAGSRRNAGTVQDLNEIVIPVPSMLTNSGIAVAVPRLIDIVVGLNSTLILNSDITHLMVNDFLCYDGARVIQQSDYVALDVAGIMMGGLTLPVYRPQDGRLHIDHSLLAQQAVFN
jgi:hypothetical protein